MDFMREFLEEDVTEEEIPIIGAMLDTTGIYWPWETMSTTSEPVKISYKEGE